MGIKAFFKKRLTLLLTWVIPACIITSYSFLALQPDLRISIPALVGVTAFITILLAATLYAGEKVAIHWSPGVIIGMAVVLRLIFLFRPPELSDDIYRYLWDGLRTLSGHNPYSMAPSQVQTHSEIYTHLLRHINHPDLITVYPPAAQIAFAAGAFLGPTILGVKALLFIIDLATCYILIRILSSLNLPSWRCILYAWHPLPVLEIAASGHIDGAGIFFFLLVLLLLLKQEAEGLAAPPRETSHPFPKKIMPPLVAGFSFASAVLVKFFPLIFFPGVLMIIKKRGRMVFLIGIISGTAVLIFPFLPEMKNSFVTLITYLQNWEFSGFTFRLLRKLTSSGSIARMLLAFIFLLSAFFSCRTFWSKKNSEIRDEARNDPGRFNLNRLPSCSLLNLMKPFYFITLSFLLLTPTLYPWYALYLVCFLPFAAGPAGIVLTWTVFLSYRVLIPYSLLGLWIEDDCTSAMIWIAPVLAFLLSLLARYRSSRISVS